MKKVILKYDIIEPSKNEGIVSEEDLKKNIYRTMGSHFYLYNDKVDDNISILKQGKLILRKIKIK